MHRVDQLTELRNRQPMGGTRQRLDLAFCGLALDRKRDDLIAQLPRGFERQDREPPVPANHRVAPRTHIAPYLITPRCDRSMNPITSSTSASAGTSARIFSIACVVFSFVLFSRRNVLCSASTVSASNPRRSRPILF